jgi:hypothetical protein
MRFTPWIGAAMVALWPAMAGATDATSFVLKTTEDLYVVCTTPPDDPLRREAINFCQGYLLAVASYDFAISDRKNLQRLICVPEGATRAEGIQGFIDWAARHQQDRKFMDEPPVVGAVRGLASKWPCK